MRKNNNSVFDGVPYKKRYIFRNLDYFLHQCKWAYQRIVRGYSDCDIWNFDMFLTRILKSAPKDLADCANGIPNDLAEQYEDSEKALKVWKAYLYDMANAFDDLEKSTYSSCDTYKEKLHKAMSMLEERFGSLWD